MKTFILSIVVAVVSSSSYAQNNNDIKPPEPIEQSDLSIGLKAGYGHSFICTYKNPVFSPSWDVAISGLYAPWVHWGIQLDAMYSEEGAKFKTVVPAPEGTTTRIAKVYVDYIRVPLKVVYFCKKYENDFRPKISLGPSVGFLVQQINVRNAEDLDYGLTGSLGFNYRIARGAWLTVDADYYQGFYDIYQGRSKGDEIGHARLNVGFLVGF